ncbi:MAG: hypothetical protein V1709_08975 [Planctomycetota bacterium]
MEILPGKRLQCNIMIGRTKEGWISVACAQGGVNILEYRSKSDEWIKLNGALFPGLKAECSTKFVVSVQQGTVKLLIDGAPVVEASVGNRDMTGPWGLSVQAGGAVLWRNLCVE